MLMNLNSIYVEMSLESLLENCKGKALNTLNIVKENGQEEELINLFDRMFFGEGIPEIEEVNFILSDTEWIINAI